MKLDHVLLVCLLSALCDGNSELDGANFQFIRTEGGSVLVACRFSLFGRRKFLCKDECREEDVLIETDGDRAQSGRYSIEYNARGFSAVLHVSIARLTTSDSGRYRCGLERPFLPDAYQAFEVRVTEAPKTLPEAVKQPAAHSVTGFVLPLVVCVTAVVLFAVVLLLLYKLKTSLSSREQSGDGNIEFTTNETTSPVFKREDSTSSVVYETSNNQHKTYCNL